jgi:hypothetical protein
VDPYYYGAAANQQLYREMMHRSTTDLSIDLYNDDEMFLHQAMEIHKEPVCIAEVHAKQMDRRLVLVVVLSNGKVIVYENLQFFPGQEKQKFRFKIVQS